MIVRDAVTYKISHATKVKAFIDLLKLRLTSLVSVSASFGYAMAAGADISLVHLILLSLGGIMVTGSSNVLNQIFEREYDSMMKRTSGRPLPLGLLSVNEALIYAILLMIGGIGILGYFFNLPTALLGIIALLSYAFVYTPMKRISPFSVFVGAIPGALPPLIGWVAYTGHIGLEGWILFMIQFFWQFPHFWAIAWQLDEDYKKAGFKMLPTSDGKSQSCANLIFIYTICLIPMAWFPFQAEMIGELSATLLVVAGLLFAIPAWQLRKTLDIRAARGLMFASFIYLPVIQAVMLWA